MSHFDISMWLMAAVIVYVVVKAIAGLLGRKSGAELVCTACGHKGQARPHTPGSIGIEIVLWLCFIVPGLIYSLWRLSKRRRVCTSCGATSLVPPDSPVARKLLADLVKPAA